MTLSFGLSAVALQDLFGGRFPTEPDRERERIYKIVLQVMHRLEKGEGVVVHCAGGTGRTGTVLGCVLRVLGFEAAEVLRYLNALHQKRGYDGWPESGWQATVVEDSIKHKPRKEPRDENSRSGDRSCGRHPG